MGITGDGCMLGATGDCGLLIGAKGFWIVGYGVGTTGIRGGSGVGERDGTIGKGVGTIGKGVGTIGTGVGANGTGKNVVGACVGVSGIGTGSRVVGIRDGLICGTGITIVGGNVGIGSTVVGGNVGIGSTVVGGIVDIGSTVVGGIVDIGSNVVGNCDGTNAGSTGPKLGCGTFTGGKIDGILTGVAGIGAI
jgi:hypothetical protein